MKCPHCGQEHPDNAKFCMMTGEKLESQFCVCDNPDCDFCQPLPLTANFCPNCRSARHSVNNHCSCDSQQFFTDYLYDDIDEFHEGLAQVRRDWKYGFIDEYGKEIIPCLYYGIYGWFENGFCVVEEENSDDTLFGVIDKNNRVIIPCLYDDISYDKDIAAFNVTKKNGLCGIISTLGETLVQFIYDRISWYVNGIAIAKKDNILKIIDKFGNTIENLPSQYCNAHLISDQLIAVEYNGKWGVIDRQGNIQVSFIFDDINPVWLNSFILISQNNKQGVMSKTGEMLLPCDYNRLFPSGANSVLVYDGNGYYSIIDVHSGRRLSSYYPSSRFSTGDYHPIENDAGIALLIDSNGQVVIPPSRYNMMHEPKNGMVPVMFHDQEEASYNEDDEDFDPDAYDYWGVIDLDTGKPIIPCMYESISIGDNGLIVAQFNGQKWGSGFCPWQSLTEDGHQTVQKKLHVRYASLQRAEAFYL